MHLVNDEMNSCIAECLRCYQTCLSTAMRHCLEIGGQHTEPQHFSLMMACAEICRIRAFHAARLGTTQTHLSPMRRDLQTMRRGL
jgi:hypothetical protein